jgi:hypothetical protein
MLALFREWAERATPVGRSGIPVVPETCSGQLGVRYGRDCSMNKTSAQERELSSFILLRSSICPFLFFPFHYDGLHSDPGRQAIAARRPVAKTGQGKRLRGDGGRPGLGSIFCSGLRVTQLDGSWLSCPLPASGLKHIWGTIHVKCWGCVGLEVLTAVVMKSAIFWDITPCSPLESQPMPFDFQRTTRRYIPEDSI